MRTQVFSPTYPTWALVGGLQGQPAKLYISISTYLQVNITGRNIVITAAREAGVDTGFVAVDDFLVFAGEDKCATQPEAARWAVIGPAELLTSYWLQGGPGHHHHRGPRRQVPRLQLRDGRVRVELGGQHRQHHRHVRLHQVHIYNIYNIYSIITGMYPFNRSKGKLHQDGDGPTHDHNENTEGITQMDGECCYLSTLLTFQDISCGQMLSLERKMTWQQFPVPRLWLKRAFVSTSGLTSRYDCNAYIY